MGQEQKSVPRFHIRAIQDEEASDKMGHPVFRDAEYVEVRHPGAMHSIPCVRVKQIHKDTWPDYYRAFKEGREVPLEGFPLEEWAPISRGICETMKSMGLRTVEDLANIPDVNVQRLGAIYHSLKIKAVRFLKEHNSEQAQINNLKEENKTLIERLEKLEASISESTKKATGIKAKAK